MNGTNSANARPGGSGFGIRAGAGLLWLALAAIGLIGLYHRFQSGHALAAYGSYVPWGLWVALYFHGAGIAAGVFLVGGLGFLSGAPGLASRAGLRTTVVLSIAALLPGLLAIGLDLGRIERGSAVFLSPSFTSVMTLNSWLYVIFLLAATLAWLLSWQKESAWLRPLVLFGAATGAAYVLGSGVFFAAVRVKPLWHNGIWPLVTLVSGLSAGAAVFLAVLGLSDAAPADAGRRLARRVLQGGLAAYLVLAGLKWFVAHFYDTAPAAGAPHALPVWSSAWFQLLLGAGLPLLLLATRRRGCWVAAALIAPVTLLGGRLDLLLQGQAPAELPGLADAFQHERLSFAYRPTAMEWQVAALLLAFAIAVYVIGQFVNKAVAARVAPGQGVTP